MKTLPLHELIATISRNATARDLNDQAKILKEHRENGVASIYLIFGGYDDDPREVWQIPQVQTICKRLEEIGYTSYLDIAGFLHPIEAKKTNGFGAMEVFLCADGRITNPMMITRPIFSEAVRRQGESNVRADANFGPYKPPPRP